MTTVYVEGRIELEGYDEALTGAGTSQIFGYGGSYGGSGGRTNCSTTTINQKTASYFSNVNMQVFSALWQ